MTLLSVLLFLTTLQSPDHTPTSVRVFVFTAVAAPGAERTEDEQERLAAVQDMREALRHRKGITLVDDPSSANVQMEVMGREQRDEPGGGYGGKSITKMGDTIIRLHVKSGEEETDLKGMGQGTYGRAAKDAADRFMKWIARREPSR